MNAIWFLVVIGGVLGYALAARAKRVFGVSPWRLHPLFWGVLCALVPVLGIVLETVAQFTTRPAPPPDDARMNDSGPYGRGAATSSPFAVPWRTVQSRRGSPAASDAAQLAGAPGAVVGKSSVPVATEPQPGERRLPGPGGWRPAELGEPTTGPPPLFGWYDDPTTRHEKRYWDGRHWWDSVVDGDVRSEDPIA